MLCRHRSAAGPHHYKEPENFPLLSTCSDRIMFNEKCGKVDFLPCCDYKTESERSMSLVE